MLPTIETQRAWERQQVEAGIRRYRATLLKVKEDGSTVRKAVADTEPGQIIAADLIVPLAVMIQERQAATVETLMAAGNEKVSTGEMLMLTLPVDVLAAVTILHALDAAGERPFTAAAISLGTKLKNEYDYVRWHAIEKDAAKDGRTDDAGKAIPNLAKLMEARNKTVDERVFKKWSGKAALFASSAWETATRLSFGTAMLTLMVESNGWFEVVIREERKRKTRVLRMTEAGHAFVRDRNNQNELTRPYLKPMLIEPIDYAYIEVTTEEATA